MNLFFISATDQVRSDNMIFRLSCLKRAVIDSICICGITILRITERLKSLLERKIE